MCVEVIDVLNTERFEIVGVVFAARPFLFVVVDAAMGVGADRQ